VRQDAALYGRPGGPPLLFKQFYRMNSVQQKRLFLSPPHLGSAELDFVREAFESNYIAPLGPMVDAFEREFAAYTGIPHCLALASGTAAMHLALRELGVGPGDEVLASTLTVIGSVAPVTFLGASVAFIDSDEESWNMDPDLLAQELAECARRGKLPKAVIPTDLYGQCCDLEKIKHVCERYQIPMVADAAEAMGSRYQRDYMTTRQQDKETASPMEAATDPALSMNPEVGRVTPCAPQFTLDDPDGGQRSARPTSSELSPSTPHLTLNSQLKPLSTPLACATPVTALAPRCSRSTATRS
jgi:hypothetical protein